MQNTFYLSSPQIFCGLHVITNMPQMTRLANQGQKQSTYLTESTHSQSIALDIFPFLRITSKLVYEVYAFHFQIIKMVTNSL